MVDCFHDDDDSCHTEQVRNDIRNDGQIDECFKLIIQCRADGHQREEGLNNGNGYHADQWSFSRCDFLHECREISYITACLEYVGNGELPAKQGTEAGENHEAHDNAADGRSEHVSKYKSEWSRTADKIFRRNNAEDDVGGNDVAGCGNQCSAENGLRYVRFRIINGICIGACRFHSEECPQGHGNSIDSSAAKAHVMYVPVSDIQGRREPEPANQCKTDTWNDDAPYSNGGNATSVFSAAKVQDGSQPECEDGSGAGHNRIEGFIQEPERITYGRNSDSSICKNQ